MRQEKTHELAPRSSLQYLDLNTNNVMPIFRKQGQGPDAVDEVEIDFSPLRASWEVMESLSEQADAVAAELKAPRVDLEVELAGGAEDAGETLGYLLVVVDVVVVVAVDVVVAFALATVAVAQGPRTWCLAIFWAKPHVLAVISGTHIVGLEQVYEYSHGRKSIHNTS